MKVQVRVFSYLREYLTVEEGANHEIELELPSGATLRDVFIHLGIDRYFEEDIFGGDVGNIFQVLVNQQAVNTYSHLLQDGDSVVMFPPMSGG
ncbi:MAG: MoaD/ThiS family protein [Chloroflexota bacterium]